MALLVLVVKVIFVVVDVVVCFLDVLVGVVVIIFEVIKVTSTSLVLLYSECLGVRCCPLRVPDVGSD